MKTVFRSSFLLALTCSKRICFPPDTDSFLCVKEWGWSIWGPVPGGAGSPRIREAGALGGGTRNAAARPRSGRALWRLRRQSQRPSGCVYQPTFVSGHPSTRLQEPLLFLPPYICCKSFPVVSHKRRGAFYSPSFLRSEWKDQKSFVCVS